MLLMLILFICVFNSLTYDDFCGWQMSSAIHGSVCTFVNDSDVCLVLYNLLCT